MGNEKKVAIIISVYNQEKLLEINLNSIKSKTGYKNYRVYLVDDSGKGMISEKIKSKFSWVNVIKNKHNLGFSKSNNIGIKKALKEYKPDYVLLLNDDCEMIQKNWLSKIVDIAEKGKKIGILGVNIRYPDLTLQNIGGYLNGWRIELELNDNISAENFEVDHVMGAFMLIKKQVIKEIGLLDEIYSPYLLEDTDYCLRAKKKGWKIISIPSVKIIHKKGKSIDSLEDKKRLLVRFKNDIIFSRRHLKGIDKILRIFIYLPLVAIFRKKKDTGGMNLNNLKLRTKFMSNLYLWFIAFFPKMYLKKIK